MINCRYDFQTLFPWSESPYKIDKGCESHFINEETDAQGSPVSRCENRGRTWSSSPWRCTAFTKPFPSPVLHTALGRTRVSQLLNLINVIPQTLYLKRDKPTNIAVFFSVILWPLIVPACQLVWGANVRNLGSHHCMLSSPRRPSRLFILQISVSVLYVCWSNHCRSDKEGSPMDFCPPIYNLAGKSGTYPHKGK